MKELYFNKDNIELVSLDIYNWLKQRVKIRPLDFDICHSALLVIDMQDYFLYKNSHAFIPSSQAIIDGIKAMTNIFNALKRPVIFTRQLNSDSDAGLLESWWNDLTTAEDPLSEISKEFDYPNMKILKKSQYDSFYNTALEETLKEKGVEHLIVTGVMTHLCCETTIRSAFVRGYNCIIPIDGTADQTIEYHKSSLLNLSHGFATPATMNTILQYIDERHECK